MSGARDDRSGLAVLMEYVREGDSVVVWKLDRLGRNTLHILETVKALTDRGVTLVSVTDGIDSSTAAGRMMMGVLSSLAEYERELVKERSALKRQASRANGARFGRPKERQRSRAHGDGEANEGRRPYRQGHRPIPRGQPRYPLQIPRRRSCLAFRATRKEFHPRRPRRHSPQASNGPLDSPTTDHRSRCPRGHRLAPDCMAAATCRLPRPRRARPRCARRSWSSSSTRRVDGSIPCSRVERRTAASNRSSLTIVSPVAHVAEA